MAAAVLSLQRQAGNKAVARSMATGERPAVQRLMSYSWGWYTWMLGWKPGAEALWRRIDITFNQQLLPLIAKLEATLGENEIHDLIDFRDRHDGTKLGPEAGKAFLAEAEKHLEVARGIAGRASTPTKIEPSATTEPPVLDLLAQAGAGGAGRGAGGPAPGQAEEGQFDDADETEPVRGPLKDEAKAEVDPGSDASEPPKPERRLPPPPEPVLGLRGGAGAGHGAGRGGAGRGPGSGGLGRGAGRGAGGPGLGPVGQLPVQGPAEDGQFDDADDVEPEKEPEKEVPVAKKPPRKKKTVRAKTKKSPGKSKKQEEPPPSPSGVTSPTAAEMAKERQTKVDAVRAAIQEFDDDHRPLKGKAKGPLLEAQKAVADIRHLEADLAAYQATMTARHAEVDKLLNDDKAELEVIEELSTEVNELEALVREGLIEHMNIDEEVTDLEGDVDLRLQDLAAGAAASAAATAELVRLRNLWRTPSLARGHFLKHTGDTGLATEVLYLTAAEALVAPGGSTHSKVRSDNGRAFFDTPTGRFSAVSSTGTIKTLFCPGDGIAYYNRQS